MAANTFSKIASVTVGSTPVANIDFTSIPALYTDLQVVYSLRTSLAGGPFYFDDPALRINSDTGNNYSRMSLRTRQGTIGSFGTSTTSFIDFYTANANNATTGAFASGSFYISNYLSTLYKPVISDGRSETNNGTEVLGGFVAGLWKQTNAITTLRLYSQNASNFLQYSTATLYGIRKN